MSIMKTTGMKKIAYGGDWNPEQWDKETVLEDVRLFKEAGIDILSINIFSWTLNQPDEDTWNFNWLDEIISLLKQNGMKVCMGTSTAAHPAWMAKKYPDILRVDFQGRKRKFGDRHNSCPSSPTYRKFASLMAGKLAQRYKEEKTIILWHVSNEFMGTCYCENCAKAFRVWLKQRYGTLEELNRAWNSRFWNQWYSDWDEIELPNVLTVQWGDRNTAMQGIALDYNRFNSDNLLDCCKLEYAQIKKSIPDAVVTTNFMGAYRQLDYKKWSSDLDIVSWDSYPARGQHPAEIAVTHDLMRGLKNGDSFLLMEQTPSQTNWQSYNALKRPGVMRLQSYQAMAHGADSVMFFQMRRGRGQCEKFHGAVIEHSGRSDTRVFREISELGKELQIIGDRLLGSRKDSKVAIWFDWNSWWAVENSMGPNKDLNYLEQIISYYKAAFVQNFEVDFVGPGSNLDSYKVILAPLLYLLDDISSQKINSFVQNGGVFATSFLSGVAGLSDLVFLGGAPGPMKDLLGLWVEETDALPPECKNTICMKDDVWKKNYSCNMIFDLVRVEDAQVIGTYGSDFYAGKPAVTRKISGKGQAWYIASYPDEDFLRDFVQRLCDVAGVSPVLKNAPELVESGIRINDRGEKYLFVLNHADNPIKIPLGQYVCDDILVGGAKKGNLELNAKAVFVGKIVSG